MSLIFHELVPTGPMLLESRKFDGENDWKSVRFFHRTSADLLSSVDVFNQAQPNMEISQAHEFPIYVCEDHPVGMESLESIYYKLMWGSDGSLKGYGDFKFSERLTPAFYSIRKPSYMVPLISPKYSGELLKVTVTKELVFYVEPEIHALMARSLAEGNTHQILSEQEGKGCSFDQFEGLNTNTYLFGCGSDFVCITGEFDLEQFGVAWKLHEVITSDFLDV
jgi:hypothetical protein